ncbi:FliH/SctL family protein [Pseudobacteriovorax antillogorgiicola]|uniref:Flagellar assembly protein FliH n=1 Tax=Pseudobacteriovorax antillogorgiicola TaxID=1513793 RepID=A0A1Y6CPX1_9BACT|nr:FliH/SctL family protein [Pseudobacteriovorax antillogorgiicola]TCS46116.1 flagellar assembly protein FliH [Pseudobacteriovorax antillogorgiicola]SMF69493.1 Flagellar assembly protein FliH [Pseudobacteriovorax antillogorgiicola]
MEESHVRLRKGRFIKKDDPICEALSITNFNLMEICETHITYADNVDANIIHTKLHLDEDLDVGVKVPREIESIFEPAEYRPVIKPLDFTQEWIKQRKRMHSRSARLDEEDEIDLEMENIARKLRKKFSKQLKKQEAASEEQEVKKIGDELSFEETIDENPVVKGDSSPRKKAGLSLPNMKKKMAEEGLPPLNPDETFAGVPTSASQQISDDEPLAADPSSTSFKEVGEAINQIAPEIPAMPSLPRDPHISDEEGFVPMSPAVSSPPPMPQEDKEEAIEKAKSKGYEDGYKIGEEKAMIVIQEKVNQILDEFSKMIHEFEGMKSNILVSAQENFQTICQSMMESLLQREFQMNPKSFETIIERAIAEAVPDDEFKVLVSQDTYDRVKDDVSDSLKGRLKVDQGMKEGNFKIESKLSVVDGNISQIIEDLLDQADIELFDKHSDDKVG